VQIDVRVIAATNLAPERLGDESLFRPDLLFRLNTVEIELPPLRERREDIPVLVDHYVGLYSKKYGRPARRIRARSWRRSRPMTGRATSARCATPPSAR
jgi:DNA-binding NtrC family response regulator